MFALIRGAGDLATGIALRLYRSGFRVAMTETAMPLAIRRTVCFSEAVRQQTQTVEGVQAVLVSCVQEGLAAMEQGKIPVLVDPALEQLDLWRPEVLVDAILAKSNLGTAMDMAPAVIGVGPGFTAGKDCHAVVETLRGHDLGRVIYDGTAAENTNLPGLIGGFAGERVLRAPADGEFCPLIPIGSLVREGDTVATVSGAAMRCTVSGVLRGLLPEGTLVKEGLKAGDVDPRGDVRYCRTVSDKALAVGGGVLEAALSLTGALVR